MSEAGGIEGCHDEARRHEAAGRFGRAVECYLEAIRERRETGEGVPPFVFLGVAELFRKLGRTGAALSAYRRVRMSYLDSGESSKAAAVEEMISVVDPDRSGRARTTADEHRSEGIPAAGGVGAMDPDRVDEVMSELEDFLESEEKDEEERMEADEPTETEAWDAEEAEALEPEASESSAPGEPAGPNGETAEDVEATDEPIAEEPAAWDEGDDRAAAVSRDGFESGAAEPESEADAGEPAEARSSVGADRPEPRVRAAEDLGEEDELRKGLEVLEELIELRPDDLDLRVRKLRYLRRLDEDSRRADLERELAAMLSERGDRHAARLLCRLILDRHPGDERTRELLSDLRGEALETTADRGSSWETAAADGPVEPGERLRAAVEEELEVHAEALPWLYRAARRRDAGDGPVPAEAFRNFARYLLLRGETEDGCRVLQAALEAGAGDRQAELEVRTDLVECYLDLDRRGEAREHLEELAETDEAFGVVWEALD